MINPVQQGKDFIDTVFAIVSQKFGPGVDVNAETSAEIIRLTKLYKKKGITALQAELKELNRVQ